MNKAIVANRKLSKENMKEQIPMWCPLKPMLQKLDANDYHRMFSGTYKERETKGYGYNACIDDILGAWEDD